MGGVNLLAPRLLYGLDEVFVALPYEVGARRTRLLLRCRALRLLTGVHTRGNTPISLGAPAVLGEVVDWKGVVATEPGVVPGTQLEQARITGVSWTFRHYRVSHTDAGLRFEAGTARIYAAKTKCYPREVLYALAQEGMHAKADTRAGAR